jgi:TetR/AcrR family transcriptional repressor of mexJK operon
VRVWTDNDPKAALMQRKRTLIVDAAREAFLAGGYAQTSMDGIAKCAGVSIKTVYRHFDDKDDLFSAVMQSACSPQGQEASLERDWFKRAPRIALRLAAMEYLQHALSDEQVSLYRVVLRDAGRFPELGRRYASEVVDRRYMIFAEYLDRRSASHGWKVKDRMGAAHVFGSLLRTGLFEGVLLGLVKADEELMQQQAKRAAVQMLILLESHLL